MHTAKPAHTGGNGVVVPASHVPSYTVVGLGKTETHTAQ